MQIEGAEAIQGLSQTEILLAVQSLKSPSDKGENSDSDGSDGAGYSVDDIQGVLENDGYADAISVSLQYRESYLECKMKIKCTNKHIVYGYREAVLLVITNIE